MAIVIPSSKTYDRQNPKVRDNVIERIEVVVAEVKDIKEFGKNVFSKTITDIIPYQEQQENSSYSSISQKQSNQHPTFINYNEYNSHSYIDISIKIPKLKGTHLIEQLLFGKKTDNSLNIGCSIFGDITTETVSGTVNVSLSQGNNNWYTANIISKNLSYSSKTTSQENYAIPKELEINSYKNVNISGVSVPSNKTELSSRDTLSSSIPTSDEDYFYITLTILCGIQTLSFSADTFGISDPNTLTVYKGERKTYAPQSIELQFYGNTIGIDLTDKTVYINGKTQKKVYSVDGNELMQTSNYIKQNGAKINAIEKMYGETQVIYAKGKETATIRCSISDYYDYNSGEKVISIDNSTRKMSFKMYDQVIPMVYGADGKDRPMSLYQDGTPKVFQVFGSKIYYDGAVWQELSLQEV